MILVTFTLLVGYFFTELVSYNPEEYMNYFNNIELCYLNALQLGRDNNLEIVDGTGTHLAAFNLDLFYELTGDCIKALKYYERSYSFNYSKAIHPIERLKSL